jgi:DNA-binding XRE family transcriptional regulator
MQAVVKTPHIELKIKGDISPKLISVLEEEFGSELMLENELEDEIVDIFETDWYTQIKSKMSPGDNLKIYRENRGLTQGQLGELLDGVPRQHISNMERGIRSISKKTARKLAQIFKVSPGKFI